MEAFLLLLFHSVFPPGLDFLCLFESWPVDFSDVPHDAFVHTLNFRLAIHDVTFKLCSPPDNPFPNIILVYSVVMPSNLKVKHSVV